MSKRKDPKHTGLSNLLSGGIRRATKTRSARFFSRRDAEGKCPRSPAIGRCSQMTKRHWKGCVEATSPRSAGILPAAFANWNLPGSAGILPAALGGAASGRATFQHFSLKILVRRAFPWYHLSRDSPKLRASSGPARAPPRKSS